MSSAIQMSTIAASVQKTLFDKMSMLEKITSISSREKEGGAATTTKYRIGAPLTDAEKGVPVNYMMARTTWMRMVSMTLGPDRQPVILQGGEVDKKEGFVSNLWGSKIGTTSTPGGGEVNPGEPITTPEKLQHGKYWTSGESQPFRPSPGLKDIRVEHRSMRQAATAPTRTTEINWICWTWQDLDRLTRHFLAPGLGVFVDWGWMGGKGTDLYDINPYPLFRKAPNGEIKGWSENINQITNNLSQYIVRQKGHYDAIIGQVYNFDWKVRDDGGFDCTTQIIGRGSLIIDTQNTIGSNHLKSRLPNIIKSDTKETYKYDSTKTKIAGRDNRISVTQTIEESTWVLPMFAAEQFFKDNTNTDYSGIYERINRAKLKAVALSTDPDFLTRGDQGEYKLILDEEALPDRTTYKISETKGGKPIGGDAALLIAEDESLGAMPISVVNIPTEVEKRSKNVLANISKSTTTKSVKFLWIKSNELLRALSPWITFDDYMNDIWNQVYYQMTHNAEFVASGNTIGIFSNIGENHIYVTWGWFEDNVISRFFGVLKDIDATDDKLYPGLSTEFRSFEDAIITGDSTGSPSATYTVKSGEGLGILAERFTDGDIDELVNMNPGKTKHSWGTGFNLGEVINVPTDDEGTLKNIPKMECRTPAGQYIFTTDTSKFLIVDKNSMTKDWVCEKWGSGWYTAGNGKYKNEDFVTSSTEDGLWASTPFGAFTDQPNCNTEIELKYFAQPPENDGKINGIIRNVYFNVEFLREKMTEQPSIGTAMKNVWQEFSNEYAGIFQFELKYNIDEDRIMVASKTWTQGSVAGMLSNKSHRMDPNAADGTPESVDNFDGLFEFPTWKAGSMVKSQNLSATLPSALKKQLSLQNTNPNSQDIEKSDDPRLVNEAKGVSILIMPEHKEPGGVLEKKSAQNEDTTKEAAMTDALSGLVDFPYRNNRWFGSNSADIKEDLFIGKTGKGIQLTENILESVIRAESFKYFNALNAAGGVKINEDTQVLEVTKEAQDVIDAKEKLLKDFHEKVKNKRGLALGGDSGFYEEFDFVTENDATFHGNYWKLNSDVRGAVNGLLKGPGGPVGEEDPLVPIDFDMDIDGIGGIFPGNAFASNYLPTRYRQHSCFQATGVEHRVDSSNWTTTIKGQIRVNLHPPVDTIGPEPESFTMQGWNPFSGIRFKLPSFPEGEFDEDLDDFIIDEMDIVEYSELEEPPPYVRPVVEVPEVVDVSALEATIGGESVTQAQIDAAMAAATERLTAAEVEVITRVQALQTFQNTLLSTLPAEFSWDTFLPVFDAITNSASAVGDQIQQSFAELDMSLALNSLYGISRITAGQVNIDGTTRAQYRIQFHSGESTVGP